MLTINTKEKKLYDENSKKELVDISDSFSPQKIEFIKSGGSYTVVFGKKLQNFACKILNIQTNKVYAPAKEVLNSNQGLTAVEKYLMLTFLIEKMTMHC